MLFALYFASSGIESLRIGLNRAYNIKEPRPWWLLRLESIGYVLVGAVALLALSFLVVLAPLIFAKLGAYVPALEPFGHAHTSRAIAVAAVVLIVALVIVHLLAAGRPALVRPDRAGDHCHAAAVAAQRRSLRRYLADSPTPMSSITPASRRR